MKQQLSAILILLLAFASNAQDSAKPITWISSDGRNIQAPFVKLDGEAVVLLINGKPVVVPFARLSSASVTEAKRLATVSQPNDGAPSEVTGLGSLIIPQFTFAGASLNEVVEYLRVKSRELDPKGIGMTIHADPSALAVDQKLSIDQNKVALADAIWYVALLNGLDVSIKYNAVQLKRAAANRPPPQGTKPSQRVARLSSLVLPTVQFDGATLAEVLEYFRVSSRNLDPDKEDLPLIIGPTLAGATSGTVTLDLKNIPLIKALQSAADLAGAEVICLGDALFLQPKNTPPPVAVLSAPPGGAVPPPVAPASTDAFPPILPLQTVLPPELSTLDEKFQKDVAEKVTTAFDAALQQLNTSYLGSLDREIAKYQSNGGSYWRELLEAEKKLLAAGQPIPAIDEKQTIPPLKALRINHRAAYAKLEADRAKNLKVLSDPLVTRLAELETTLTKKDRVDDAKVVREYRDTLVKRSPETQQISPAKLKRFVEDVVFGGAGYKVSGVIRWLSVPHLVVHSSDPALKTFVEKSFAEICEAAKLPTTRAQELTVYIGATGELLKMDGLKSKKITVQADHNWMYWSNGDWSIKETVIYLRMDRLSGSAAQDALLKDLLVCFGFFGKSREFDESCLSSKQSDVTELSALDKKLITFFYTQVPLRTGKSELRKLFDAHWNQ